MPIDDFTLSHLADWLDNYIHDSEREEVLTSILRLLMDEPDLPNTRSWDEIRRMAAVYKH